ncbi:hypothetical protein [Nocardioides daejeonensis]|uniref:hypothetical protein n=1 Tax=Nocardioides daejeonensis TaxID=1046556 RepID=UPI000D745F25|nr:hypothetical protein [Nocardioides daejeonensis]
MPTYGPGTPLVFSHIPKTAGTSLGAALEQVLQPRVVVRGIDSALFGGYDDINAVAPLLRPGIYLSPEEIPADAALVAGHVAPATTQARFPGADHVTVLRTPQVRLLSQWLHSRSLSEFSLRHWGLAADAFRAGRKPLREYLDNDMIAPTVDNAITRFLAWPHSAHQPREFIDEAHDDELVAAALERLDGFAHVNLVENPDFLADLSAWLGVELPDTQLNERTSVPPQWRPDLAAELDPATRELLDHRCRLDVRVWKAIAERVLPDRDPDQVLTEAFDQAVERYTVMLQRPYDAGTARRLVERAWDAKLAVTGPSTKPPSARPPMVAAVEQLQHLRRVVPVKAVPGLVERRLEKLWQHDGFRRVHEAEMEFVLGDSPRAGEIPELARAYAAHMMTRSYMRWHPKAVSDVRLKGIERVLDRDKSRGLILSFTHHHRYDGMWAAFVRAGAPRSKIVITEGITRPEAGIQFAQHLRVGRPGGDYLMAESGTKALAAELTPGVVLGMAVDFPGRTPVEFLGKTVLAPFGTPRLAELSNSPIVLVTHRRDAEGPYVQFEEPIDPADYSNPVDLLQEVVRRHSEPILDWPEALESPRARFGFVDPPRPGSSEE